MFSKEEVIRFQEIAISAVLDAGATILEIYKKDFKVAFKEDESPLTIADQEANFRIEQILKTTQIPIISEESKQLPYAERVGWEHCWIVDPLDGTKEFIKKNDEFTVNIALVENGKPIMGVIFAPALKELYYGNILESVGYKAIVGEGDTVATILNNSQPIAPKQHYEFFRVVGSRSHMNEDTLQFVDQLKENTTKKIDIISRGSSLKLCLVAEGIADVYPRFAPTMEWDIAAGHAICNAVGLKVLQQNTHQELHYNKENLLNPYFSVSND
ncbi:3'(2'),5'-bisphosphate nucleotidase CysQ [Flavobacterium sp.]|uniref:3'(2'),5'-bisphosphate nucleotidase CysQ n=1 Tax=Flavobacterium sp. TaxID=239 RepID=UPI00391882AE